MWVGEEKRMQERERNIDDLLAEVHVDGLIAGIKIGMVLGVMAVAIFVWVTT